MEISQNDEEDQRNTTPVLHTTQSQPIFLLENKTLKDEKQQQKKNKIRRVSFASSSQLTQYLEPLNPFESFAVPVSNSQELSDLYKKSCEKHKTQPIPTIIEHLQSLNLENSSSRERIEILNLKQHTLTHDSCEALEELFKRVKYRSIDLTSCKLDDISSTSLFEMIEYYESCNELNISENANIKNRGLLSCINMIKKSQALHSLSTRGTIISDSNAIALGNALLSSNIYTLKLEHAQLSGRPILCLCGVLQKNKVLKELCLANNDLTPHDAFHIGNVLKNNYHLQLLDISNNDILDEGFRHIAEALSYQSEQVSKTSSADSSSSIHQKFDFSDFTTNLNNINNNRNRFCPTPPPQSKSRSENSNSLNVNTKHNNNNSILQCDNDKSDDSISPLVQQKSQEQQKNDERPNTNEDAGQDEKMNEDGSQRSQNVENTLSNNPEPTNIIAIVASTNIIDENEVKRSPSVGNNNNNNNKYKYTVESLSPISQSYDDATGTHTLFSAHSPERSFSSESLCSTESVESNDSKSSIKLIESKFSQNRNGTLERQNYQNYSSSSTSGNDNAERKATGLQVLILWNNNLTSACATSSVDLFECTEYLQIINFGQNQIGNEFLVNTKSSLKLNESIISLGLQATNITCDGLKVLAEILEFGGNRTLQRIDLRNNYLSLSGLSTLSEALNSNKTITRIDLDDIPKNPLLPDTSEYRRLLSTIRQQCLFNENPQDSRNELLKASTSSVPQTTPTLRNSMKRSNLTSRKISLTCPSAVKILPQKQQQFLEPIKKQTTNRSPSPILSPSSPLTSPSRNRFQVSRVSESSSSGIGSKSPSSSSCSPTFFPSSSRFRVVAVSESQTKSDTSPQTPLKSSELNKSIDIPIPSAKPFINISNPAMIASSQSDYQLDYEEKRFIDLDSCSSFSSSIDSIDRQVSDISSTDSFDIVVDNKIHHHQIDVNSKEDSSNIDSDNNNLKSNDEDVVQDKKDIFSNENTLTISTSSSTSSNSSNEGLTLTTNSPSELSPKQEQHKRTRKTSWIHRGSGGGTSSTKTNENTSTTSYPATLDKLLNLFHHPSSLFSKTSPDVSLKSSTDEQQTSTQQQLQPKQSGMGQKENSISGFLQSLVSLTSHGSNSSKKEDKITSQETKILQNISPDNTIDRNTSNPQMILESLPKSLKKELKENISPENTISCENYAIGLERQTPKGTSSSKVIFVVGDDDSGTIEQASSNDLSCTEDIQCSPTVRTKNDECHDLEEFPGDSLTTSKNDQQDQ